MALSRLDSLYMAVVSDHSKNPHHHGKLEDVNQVNLNNPTCGDVISLSVKIDNRFTVNFGNSNNINEKVKHLATMIQEIPKNKRVLGKTKEEALELAEIFSKMVQGEKDDAQKRLGEASFLAGVSKFPQRIKCSTLAWNALKKAIENDDKDTER